MTPCSSRLGSNQNVHAPGSTESLQTMASLLCMQEEYAREGIDWSYVEFVDNQDCLDLLEGTSSAPGLAVFPLIDEACRLPRATFQVISCIASPFAQIHKFNKAVSYLLSRGLALAWLELTEWPQSWVKFASIHCRFGPPGRHILSLHEPSILATPSLFCTPN